MSMNAGWLVLSAPIIVGSAAWLTRFVAARLALRRLRRLTGHRVQLERCWQLISQVPATLLSRDCRRALGKILGHHLARSRRAGVGESGQELRIAHFVGHRANVSLPVRPSKDLAQALNQLIEILDDALAHQLIPVNLHLSARDQLAGQLASVNDALQQRQNHIEQLLHTPFGPRAAART